MNRPPREDRPSGAGGGQYKSKTPPESFLPPRGSLLTVFQKGLDAQPELMDIAHSFARELVSGQIQVKHHQLRLLLDLAIRVKQSHKDNLDVALSPSSRGRLAVMRPRLAYMAARERGLAQLQVELDLLLRNKDAFKTGADLDRLYEFVAAVVAYHRYEEANRAGH